MGQNLSQQDFEGSEPQLKGKKKRSLPSKFPVLAEKSATAGVCVHQEVLTAALTSVRGDFACQLTELGRYHKESNMTE